MPSILRGARTALAWFLLPVSALLAQAPGPSETLLPATTKVWISVPDLARLAQQWEKTQLGQLMQDPTMKEFAEDLRGQLEERLTEGGMRLGLRWEDFKDVPTGEVALARIQPGEGKAAVAIVMHTAGHRKEAEALMRKVTANLLQQGAKEVPPKEGQPPVTRIDLPKPPGDEDQKSVYYAVTDHVLLISDDAGVIGFLMVRAAGKGDAGQTLAEVKALKSIMARCQKEAGQQVPQVRWFLEPFGYFEVMQALNPDRLAHRRKGRSLLDVLKSQGFTAIQGIGGFVDFSEGEYELLHRTAVFAPPPHENSMKMLKLPNGKDFAPQPWVPKDVANYTTVYADILNAFDNFGPFFDEMFGDGEKGVWKEVVDGIKNDPNGPRIDLRNDLMVHLAGRATMITDYELPITPTSERLLYAVETRDETKVADAIRRIMEKDKTMRKLEYGGHVIWEAIPGAGPPAKPKVELGGVPPLGPPPKPQAPPPPRVLPTAAMTVAHGHLLVASHVEFLKKVLDHGKKPDPLADRLDYKLVDATTGRFGVPENCARVFSRTDEEYRATYELIRQGKMPQSETLFGRVLNRMFGTGKKGEVRKQQIDGSKLPDYQLVARYLGPAGMFAYSEADGWFAVGFTLKK